jgi:hypothetical protein
MGRRAWGRRGMAEEPDGAAARPRDPGPPWDAAGGTVRSGYAAGPWRLARAGGDTPGAMIVMRFSRLYGRPRPVDGE